MNALAGSARLVRLAACRDRVRLMVWLGGMSALLAAQTAVNAQTYATEADRVIAATLLAGNPALRMVRGAAADASLGALVLSDSFWVLAVLTAMLSSSTVVRHTRQNEETGRGELLGAAPLGSHASLVAAVLFATVANLTLAGLLALALVLNDLPFAGSVAAGASVGAVGLAFTGIAAVAAQLAPSSQAASSLCLAALAAAYLLRAAGDALGTRGDDAVSVTSAWPSWLTPLGWGQQVRAFAENDWWPLGLSVLVLISGAAFAAGLSGRRDFGRGMFPQRSGPPNAPRSLLRPFGMAWRMQRGVLLGWAVGMLFLGGLFGSVGAQIADLSTNKRLTDLLASLGATGVNLSDTFFAAAMALTGAVSAGYPLHVVLRLHNEEASGRLEPILATALGRTRWLLVHLILAGLATCMLLTLAGVAAGLTNGLLTRDVRTQVAQLTGAALIQTPAVFALCGVAVALFGLLPRWTVPLTWASLIAAVLLGPLGDTLRIPRLLRDISPFTHTPAAPAVEITLAPVLLLLGSATVLTTVGAWAFHHRDMA